MHSVRPRPVFTIYSQPLRVTDELCSSSLLTVAGESGVLATSASTPVPTASPCLLLSNLLDRSYTVERTVARAIPLLTDDRVDVEEVLRNRWR